MNYYLNLREIQYRIVSTNTFTNGELFKIVNTTTINAYAEKLTEKFFPKVKDLVIYKTIKDLYRVYLVIAPIIQKIPLSYKLNWTRGHYFGILRKFASNRINRKWWKVRVEERVGNEDRLERNLRKLGVCDGEFLNFMKEVFKKNYPPRKGRIAREKLACCIFDPIMFYHKKEKWELRRGSEFVKMEREKFEGAVSIEEQEIEFWDYKFKKTTDKNISTLQITLREKPIQKFKEEVERVLMSNASPNVKMIVLNKIGEGFIETHKYAKDSFAQIKDLNRWFKKRVKKLAGTERKIKEIDLVRIYKEKAISKLLVVKSDFFWDVRQVEEQVYVNYFSPYREG